MLKIKDQLHRELNLSQTPKRIVSLVPSQTELLVDLGLEEKIVGLTKFCVHPPHLRSIKKVVGGTKQLNYAKVKALQPDIILCNKEENTKEMVEELGKIAPVHVSDIFTVDDSMELIKQYGALFECHMEADRIVNKIKFNLKDFQNFIKGESQLKVAYFIWRNPWMVAANNTFINHLLELNNFNNVYAVKERYPEVVLENISEHAPTLILLSSEPYPFKEIHALEIEKYAKNAKIVFVDGEYFSWYGSRLTNAFDYFKKLREAL